MQRLKLSSTLINTKKLLNTLHGVEINIQDILTVSRKQEEKAIAAIKENPKFFYKYAAKYSKPKSNIGTLIDEQYESVFSQPDPKCFQNLNEYKPQLTDFIFSHVDIEKAIEKLRSNSAGHPYILLKKCKLSLSKPTYSL